MRVGGNKEGRVCVLRLGKYFILSCNSQPRSEELLDDSRTIELIK